MAVNTVKATINGVTHNLTYNSSSGKYEATITAPSGSSYPQPGHFYSVQVQATDVAGNTTTKDATDPTLGASLKLTVKEKVAPNIVITAPTSGAMLPNNKPTITWTVTDSDSGVNPDTIKLTIDATVIQAADITKNLSSGTYTCSYTPTAALADGSHTLKFDADDFDGNKAAQKSVTFKVDTVPPTLTVTSPVDNFVTNNSALTVQGTTNDATSSPVTLTVKLNTGAATAVTVNGDGSFSKALTLANGANTIVITATDGAGKVSTVTRNVTLDTAAPVITAISLTPNPVDAGATYVIAVTVTD